MKKKFLILCLIATTGLLFYACDYVRDANPAKTSSTGGTTGTPGIVYRKVLVEDYTGHKCGNCPAAARELTRLDTVYAGKVIPLAVHAGYFAAVTPGSNPPYPTDLNSTTSTDYDNIFQNSIAGNPNGLVNRVGYGTAGFIQQSSSWSSSVNAMDTMKAEFKIDLANSYNAGSNQVTATVTVTALAAKTTGQYNLVVLLSEDSIIGEQLDYSLVGQQYITNYVFNHVLRKAVNSSWGDTLYKSGTSLYEVKTKTYANFQLASNWKHNHCHIIAFVYDATTTNPTYYEILQVEMKDVN